LGLNSSAKINPVVKYKLSAYVLIYNLESSLYSASSEDYIVVVCWHINKK